MIVADDTRPVTTADPGTEAALSWRLLPVVLVCAFAIIGYDISDGTPYLADVDDRLRALQISQLLASGRWFDLTLPMIRMPEAYISHWSRLVDFPYVAISVMLSVFMDPAKAMHWSFLIWPPTMLLAYCVLVMRILRGLVVARLSNGGFVIIAMMLFMVLAICEFSPGRIDHHNVQILLLLAMLAGTLAWNSIGGLAVGIAAALSLAVGLECMPIVAVLLSGIVLAWLFGADGAARMLRIAMTATALSTPIAALVLIGPVGFVSTQCDAFSAPYVYLASLLALAAAGATWFCGQTDTSVKRLLVLLGPGAAVVAGFLWLFPGCTGGPYGIIDPVSRQFWFDRLRQEDSVLDYFRSGLLGPVALLAGLALIMLLAWPQVSKALRQGRPQQAIVFVTSLTSLLLAVVLIRFTKFPAVLVPLFLPAAFQALVADLEQASQCAKALVRIGVACLSMAAAAAVAYWLTASAAGHFDVVDSLNLNDCASDEIGKLAWPPSAIVMAPPVLAFAIAERAPAGLAVSAIAFHRASPGLHRTYLAFTTSDAEMRRAVMAPYNYVAVCRDALPADGKAPLYAALASGGSWPGLQPVGDDNPHRPLRLFRIDHDRLQ